MVARLSNPTPIHPKLPSTRARRPHLQVEDLLKAFNGRCQTHTSRDDHLQSHEKPFPMCSLHSFPKRRESSYPSPSKVSFFFCFPTVGCPLQASPPSFSLPPQGFLEELGVHQPTFSTMPLLSPPRFQTFHNLHGLGLNLLDELHGRGL